MSGIHRFSDRVVEYAERLSDVADAAEGKRRRERRASRRLVLPAAGAAAYALVKSDFFSRQAKRAFGEARSLAAELPDDLMTRVQQTTGGATSTGNGSSRRSSTRRKSTSSSTRRASGSSRSKTRQRAGAR
jgi:hypothetical protein